MVVVVVVCVLLLLLLLLVVFWADVGDTNALQSDCVTLAAPSGAPRSVYLAAGLSPTYP